LVLRFTVEPALFVVAAALCVLCVAFQQALFIVSVALCVLRVVVSREYVGPFLVQAL
jgi:hypothetical protein